MGMSVGVCVCFRAFKYTETYDRMCECGRNDYAEVCEAANAFHTGPSLRYQRQKKVHEDKEIRETWPVTLGMVMVIMMVMDERGARVKVKGDGDRDDDS